MGIIPFFSKTKSIPDFSSNEVLSDKPLVLFSLVSASSTGILTSAILTLFVGQILIFEVFIKIAITAINAATAIGRKCF